MSIEILTKYTKNNTVDIGSFPIATGAITNCPVTTSADNNVEKITLIEEIIEDQNNN